MTVWRRFGAVGEIKITGISKTVSNSSIPVNQEAATAADISILEISTIISDGVTVGEISVPLPDNDMSAPLRVFQFVLTNVERVPVPSGLIMSVHNSINHSVVIITCNTLFDEPCILVCYICKISSLDVFVMQALSLLHAWHQLVSQH